MGIRGLTAFLKLGSISSISDHVDLSAGHDVPTTENPMSNSSRLLLRHIIVIDGNAFSHWFCLECFGTAPSLNTNYRLLKSHVASWIMRCHATNVDCVFVFDGATDQDKLRCRFDRLCKQSANVDFALSKVPLRRRSMAVDNEFHSAAKIQSTPPLLAISCIINAIGTLQSTQTRSFYAKGEADKTIVEVAIALNATAIMSNDSDMLIYDTVNVGFIPFWGFGFADDGSLNAFIIRRRKLSKLLGIGESSLPILAALVGNDFTSAETCYHMHKILFEVSKATKDRSANSSSNVSLDKSDNFHTDMGLENTELCEEKRQRTISKPKMRRGDSTLSSSDRMKSRRRANKVEEESKRKANHIKCIESMECAPTAQTKQSDEFCESNQVLSSSLGVDAAWAYGESGVKTVKAAAAFLRKAEVACRAGAEAGAGENVISSVGVTAHLLGLSEEEALCRLASEGEGSQDNTSEATPKGLSKASNLCSAFFAAFENSIERYRISKGSTDCHPVPATNAGSMSRKVSQSALRCCFRCSSCNPRCDELVSGALAELLLHRSKSSAPNLNPDCTSTGTANRDTNAVGASLEFEIKLSPDMDQVLSSNMFIGRTPCSLYCHQVDPSLSNGDHRDEGQLEAGNAIADTNVPPTLGLHCVGDYVLLQSLRRRIYSVLFQEELSVTAQSERAEQLIVLEIFKKNDSPHLERRVVQVSCMATEMAALRSRGAIDTSAEIAEETLESFLMESAAFLVLGESALPKLQFFFSTCGTEQLSIFHRRPRFVRNQFFFSLVTAHLFLIISSTEHQMHRDSDIDSDDIAREASSSLIAAAAYLISCTFTLMTEERDLSSPSSSGISSQGIFTQSDLGAGLMDVQENGSASTPSRDCESDGLTLLEINTWTRLQLCLQHVNFSFEVAAWNTNRTTSKNGFPGQKLGQKIRIKESASRPAVDGVLQLLLGGDPGLMDPVLFFRVASQLQEPVSQLALALRTSEKTASAASALLLTSLQCISESLLPLRIDSHTIETLHSAVMMMAASNVH
jgi:hypothetical protein